jgi:hypothetical protein
VFKPNFTGIARDGTNLVVSGTSDASSVADILSIHVTLAQGETIERALVKRVGASWTVPIPAGGFEDGPAVVFGVEARRENATTITWSQALEVPKA